jgi:hypothetical protein
VPTLRERLSQAKDALLGRENRKVPMPMESAYNHLGLATPFDPHKALSAYVDNPWLGCAADRIAREIARAKFHLQTANADGEIEIIKVYEALLPLKKPQLTKDSKCLRSDTSTRRKMGCESASGSLADAADCSWQGARTNRHESRTRVVLGGRDC